MQKGAQQLVYQAIRLCLHMRHASNVQSVFHCQFAQMILLGGIEEKIGNIVVGYLATQVNVALCLRLKETYQHLRHALLLVVILVQKLVTFPNVTTLVGSQLHLERFVRNF